MLGQAASLKPSCYLAALTCPCLGVRLLMLPKERQPRLGGEDPQA